MAVNEDTRMKLIQVLEKVILPQMTERYWEDNFNKRAHTEDGKFERDIQPFSDMFKVGTRASKSEVDSSQSSNNRKGFDSLRLKNKKEVVMICTVPSIMHYWDIILSAYMLYAPQVFVSPSRMVESIYEGVRRFQINPLTHYENMPNYVWGFLDCIRDGHDHEGKERYLRFLQGGIPTLRFLIEFKAIFYSWTNLGKDVFDKPELMQTPEFIEGLQQAIKKLVDEVIPLLGLDMKELEQEDAKAIAEFNMTTREGVRAYEAKQKALALKKKLIEEEISKEIEEIKSLAEKVKLNDD